VYEHDQNPQKPHKSHKSHVRREQGLRTTLAETERAYSEAKTDRAWLLSEARRPTPSAPRQLAEAARVAIRRACHAGSLHERVGMPSPL